MISIPRTPEQAQSWLVSRQCNHLFPDNPTKPDSRPNKRAYREGCVHCLVNLVKATEAAQINVARRFMRREEREHAVAIHDPKARPETIKHRIVRLSLWHDLLTFLEKAMHDHRHRRTTRLPRASIQHKSLVLAPRSLDEKDDL